MDPIQLRTLLEQVRAGAVDIDAAMGRLRHMPFEDLGFAKVDHHRALRDGIPEVIFGSGKTSNQVLAIAERLLENQSRQSCVNGSFYYGGERAIRTLELSSRSAICRKHVAKDATRANNATPPCPILPDGLVIEAVPALPKPQDEAKAGPNRE